MSENTEDLIRLSFFTEMARDIASATSLDETLDAIMVHVGTVFAPRNWSLLLRDAQSGELVFRLVTGGEEVTTLQGQRLAPGTGIAGWIAENHRPLVIPDVTVDPRFDPSMDELSNFTTRSIIGVPLISRGEVFGVIELINKLNGEPFTALDLKVLCTIADFAAIAIEKAYYLKALHAMALEDDLTGLANRRALTRTLDREIRRVKRTGESLALLMVDIDEFKMINDTHGHIGGDRVLRHLAEVLTDNVRGMDTVCRYGGDEFVVVMPNTTEKDAGEVRNRILATLNDGIHDPTIPFSVSIGVSAAGPETVDTLFSDADILLYRDKEAKRESGIDRMSRHLTELIDEDTPGLEPDRRSPS